MSFDSSLFQKIKTLIKELGWPEVAVASILMWVLLLNTGWATLGWATSAELKAHRESMEKQLQLHRESNEEIHQNMVEVLQEMHAELRVARCEHRTFKVDQQACLQEQLLHPPKQLKKPHVEERGMN